MVIKYQKSILTEVSMCLSQNSNNALFQQFHLWREGGRQRPLCDLLAPGREKETVLDCVRSERTKGQW